MSDLFSQISEFFIATEVIKMMFHRGYSIKYFQKSLEIREEIEYYQQIGDTEKVNELVDEGMDELEKNISKNNRKVVKIISEESENAVSDSENIIFIDFFDDDFEMVCYVCISKNSGKTVKKDEISNFIGNIQLIQDIIQHKKIVVKGVLIINNKLTPQGKEEIQSKQSINYFTRAQILMRSQENVLNSHCNFMTKSDISNTLKDISLKNIPSGVNDQLMAYYGRTNDVVRFYREPIIPESRPELYYRFFKTLPVKKVAK